MENEEAIRAAHADMKRRGWGFARNRATGTYAIGPIDGWGWVDVLAFDTDFVKAMEKAIMRHETRAASLEKEK